MLLKQTVANLTPADPGPKMLHNIYVIHILTCFNSRGLLASRATKNQEPRRCIPLCIPGPLPTKSRRCHAAPYTAPYAETGHCTRSDLLIASADLAAG